MSYGTQIKDLFKGALRQMQPGKAMQAAVEKNEERIIEANNRQLDQGIDGKGKSLGRYKNFKYKNRFQPVDLKKSGDYRNRKTVTADEKKTEIFSQDWKEPILEKRYGKNISLVNPSTMQAIIEDDFKDEMQKQVK